MNERDKRSLEPATPEKLRAALSRLNARQIAVPKQVDDLVLRTAREHLDSVTRKARMSQVSASTESHPTWAELCASFLNIFAVRRWVTCGVAAVMMIAVGALVWLNRNPQLALGPEDLNADGVVDMLDAFALARELQQSPASHSQLDLNQDGMVNERDVQTLAARAVSLDQGGHS